MITALIHARQEVEPLAATLSALVPGVAEGLVADAVVVAGAADERVGWVAEAAGAALVVLPRGGHPWAAPWAAGAALARRPWLLCLEAGDVPDDGWIAALDRFLGRPARDVRLARFDRASPSVVERAARWRDLVMGASRPGSGDLIHRSLLEEWPRRLRPHRLRARLERAPL